MKAFNRVILIVLSAAAFLIAAANAVVLLSDISDGGRPYRVEIGRIALEIENGGLESVDLSGYEYITHVEAYGKDFCASDSDYAVREINGTLYRFDYQAGGNNGRAKMLIILNTVLGIMALMIVAVMLYIRRKILKPFEMFADVPYELSKGNLTMPVKETKNRFFGRFIWGVDMLRETMEQQKAHELDLQREKKMLLLSLSHDIRTPLSAIKLYTKAISKGLYDGKEKQVEIAENINAKADEIEVYVSQIITASREDFLSLDVNMGEFYLSELINEIGRYYTEKLSMIKTDFIINKYFDCLLKGDLERSIEVLQNVMENAVKYGDGNRIEIGFSEEEGCVLIAVSNSGCSISDTDLPHIFESFWRGANARNEKGSGLGLYISRQLMNKMNGEIFAEIKEEHISVISVFTKA